ncbi:AAA family ATPase, partial [Vibrio alginolyticus]|nr:AAA family ATPase [Vibrio alginolyticus]
MLDKMELIDGLYSKGIIKNPLEYLKINKFRQFNENLTISFDHPFTVLVGKNGTGKSTLLKLIMSMGKGRNPNDYFFETEWDRFSDRGLSEIRYKLNDVDYKEINTNYFGWVCSEVNQELNTNKEIKEFLSENP